MMIKLPFLLPDFSRVIWHSANAKSAWADRISKINSAWALAEREAVVTGLRSSCLTFVDPQHLSEVSLWAAVRGLVVLPVATQGMSNQYSATPLAYAAGRPWHYRIVLTKPKLAAQWAEVWTNVAQAADNNKNIGELLGYPSCCQDFFELTWVQRQGVDTTWQMAEGTPGVEVKERVLRIGDDTPPESNIILRWLGARLVPHLPCSFNCSATVQSGKQFAELMRRDNPEALDWLYEMLDWPVEWSALHGIAQVKTPVLTVSTRTDSTAEEYVVRKAGKRYPGEGASGLRFPFRIVSGKVTEKPAFKRSMLPIHELNGFGSEEYMNRAHDALLSLLPIGGQLSTAVLQSQKPCTCKDPEKSFSVDCPRHEPRDAETRAAFGLGEIQQVVGTLLDLGCGNGRFLERASGKGWKVTGIEMDQVRAGAAQIPVRRANLFDVAAWSEHFDVVAFMPGRLLEDTAEAAEVVRSALRSRARSLLVYAYGDVLSREGGLEALITKAGLSDWKLGSIVKADGVEAALATLTT